MAEPDQESRPPRWRAPLLVALVVVVVGSILLRQSIEDEKRGAQTGIQHSLVPGEEEAEAKEPSKLEKILPFLTEAGSAMLLGFMLALATRFALKMVIFAMVVIFVGLQFLAYKGLLTIDWGDFAVWIKDAVLNVTGGADVGQIVQEKLPAIGAGLLGYLLGLKRG
ncbi:MAG: FUN14 domain-containing protein [Planctomycetota bacterium]|jgi:uncharacterized membrane protein (Fun14 family)